MLDQLVESSSHKKETVRRGGFLLSTFVVVCTVLLSGVLWSLFAKDLSMGADDFELSTLIAPIQIPEDAPPPEPLPKQVRQEKTVDVTTRQANIARLDEPQYVPKDISVVPNTQKARPQERFIISKGVELDAQSSVSRDRGNDIGTGINLEEDNPPASSTVKNIPEPPPLITKKENTKPPGNTRVSLGVANGKAVNLVKPSYPPTAQSLRITGAVNVQILIDEKGNVTSANAVSGHPLLRQAAETAARASKFNPTLLSNEPVKATGVIVYKFTAQ